MINLILNDSTKFTREFLDFINNHRLAYGLVNEVLPNDDSSYIQGEFYDVYSDDVLVGFLQLLISEEDEGYYIEINFGIFDEYKGNNYCEECLKEYFRLDIAKRYITQAFVYRNNPNKNRIDKILTKLGFEVTCNCIDTIEYTKPLIE